jgi:hypothetical protein
MSLRTFVLAPVCLAVLFVAAVCRGEDNDQYMHSDPYQPDLMQPFIAPDTFDLDYQFFAPADFDTYGGDVPLRTGWFVQYSRMYLAVSRPDHVGAPYNMDKTWGNRYDIGYMSDEDHGWMFTVSNLGGPNEVDTFTRFNNIELDKVFRLKPFHNGSVMELFIGARYVNLGDSSFDQLVIFNPVTGLTTIFDTADHSSNDLIGGEIGARWYKKKGRWTLSADGRAYAAPNFQQQDGFTRIYVFADPADPPLSVTDIFSGNGSSDFFVPAGELRVEAQYDMTRDLSLNVGFNFLYFGRGMFRLVNDDQSVAMAGVTFGIVYNH